MTTQDLLIIVGAMCLILLFIAVMVVMLVGAFYVGYNTKHEPSEFLHDPVIDDEQAKLAEIAAENERLLKESYGRRNRRRDQGEELGPAAEAEDAVAMSEIN